jgi:hypothetical protein
MKNMVCIEPRKELKITGITVDGTGNYVYRVLIEGELKWVKRSYLVPKFLLELCEFYEENLTIKN